MVTIPVVDHLAVAHVDTEGDLGLRFVTNAQVIAIVLVTVSIEMLMGHSLLASLSLGSAGPAGQSDAAGDGRNPGCGRILSCPPPTSWWSARAPRAARWPPPP
ncbi:MAG: hypothetical protein LH468_05080 [Nocardioides sp.]|nr:hypothetical protein [Nocardioides sp.]